VQVRMSENTDWRNLAAGWEIPTERYSDQPYVVKTDDGAWLCCLTTGSGREGEAGQHVVALRSTDQGRTWSDPVDVEPADGPEASYAVLLKVPSGRIYCFYNHNTDNVRWVPADDPPFSEGKCYRVDSLGHYVFKYSDDGGRTWSPKRYEVPVREFAIDRENTSGGELRYFWNVGRPFVHDGVAYCSLHKVGGFGEGFFTRSEGVLLRSDNLLTETDPARIRWETLPAGEVGLRTPPGGGPIAEEQSYVVLSDGSFYSVYRTVDGHPACAYSRDQGYTWTEPRYQCYADGRLMKHPRAANFVWRLSNGKYLYWFHNHGGRGYEDRNPAWLCGGVEADSPAGKVILWSQPEIVLYDDDPFIRMSYPDLIEDEGQVFLTETQKDKARVHRIDQQLLDGLWNQFDNHRVATNGLIRSFAGTDGMLPAEIGLPPLREFVKRDSSRPDFGTHCLRTGFSFDLWLRCDSLRPGQLVLDSRTVTGRGFCLQTTSRGTVELVLNDGRTENRWDCDPGLLERGRLHHVAVIVDGGPRLILFLVDGRLCDGGEFRQFGWGRFSPHLRGVIGSGRLRVAPTFFGDVATVRVYDRALRVSEAVGNFRAGPGAS